MTGLICSKNEETINMAENRITRLKEDGVWIFSCGCQLLWQKLILRRKTQ